MIRVTAFAFSFFSIFNNIFSPYTHGCSESSITVTFFNMLGAFLWDFLSWLTGLFRKRNIKILLELIHRKCCQQHYQSFETLLICQTCTTTKKTVKWFFRGLNQRQHMIENYSKFVPYACIHHLVIHLLSVVHYCLQMVFLNHLIDYNCH